MKVVTPWVGSQYASVGIGGKRILIVGESAYKKGGYPPGYDVAYHTCALVADAIGYDEGRGYWNSSRFYTRIYKIFGHDPHSFASRKSFWNLVAYCNFIPEILSGPRVTPQAYHWAWARQVFPEVLKLTNPDIAICFSKRMWVQIPKDRDSIISNNYQCYAKKASIVNADKCLVRLLSFKHPTAPGFKWEQVKDIMDASIDGA